MVQGGSSGELELGRTATLNSLSRNRKTGNAGRSHYTHSSHCTHCTHSLPFTGTFLMPRQRGWAGNANRRFRLLQLFISQCRIVR